MTTTKKYQLVRVDPILDKRGDTRDWIHTVVAEGNTKLGLINHARLKYLDKSTHIIEELTIEDGRVIDEATLGSIYDIMK